LIFAWALQQCSATALPVILHTTTYVMRRQRWQSSQTDGTVFISSPVTTTTSFKCSSFVGDINQQQLEKVVIVMHCNLRPPDVRPVVLGFNYERYNALSYNFNNAATSTDPQCIHTPTYNTVKQSAVELLLFKYVQFGHHPPSWIWSEVNFHKSTASEDHAAPFY